MVVAVLLSPCTFSAAAGSPEEEPPGYSVMWRRGEYSKALETLDKMIEERGSLIPTRYLVDRAELRYETGRIDEAIADLESLQNRYFPPAAMLRLALLYREHGRTEDYLQMLGRTLERTRAVTRYSADAESLLVLGRVAELQGQNPKVILNSLYATLMERAPDYAPGFVAAGDLAYRKWDYQLASEYYEKALKIDENNQEALAGLAECYWKSSDPRVEKTLERLLSLNPHHPRAQAIRIETVLDAGRTDESLQLIDEALAINPNRMRMLALLSAAWFLRDGPTSMAATQARAFKINPHASEVLRVPGRIASRHYRFHEGAELQKKALEVDPDDYLARAYYGVDLLRLGLEEEGKRQLEQAFEADRYNVVVFNMLNLLDSLKRFESIERGPFVVQLPRAEAPILAHGAFALLEEAYKVFPRKYGVELETPVRIQIFDNHDDFMVRSVGLPGTVGFLGICFGRLVTMDSPSARSKWESNWKSVLWHEFVHVITLQKTNNRVPRWLSEGISVYEETCRDTAWGQRLSLEYKAIVENEPLPGLTALEGYFTNPKSAMHLMFGYLAASEFVRFYVDRYGFAALRETLDRIAKGEDAVPALAESAGAPREELDAEFQKHFEQRLAPYDNLPSIIAKAAEKPGRDRGASMTLALMEWNKASSPFTDAMQSAEKALESGEWDKAAAALEKAHGLFPDYAGDDAPLRQLIALYERRNRREDLRAALQKQVAWDATDFVSCRRLVGLLEEDQAWPEMLRVAETALGIDPFDVEMRRSVLKGYMKTKDREKALEILNLLAVLDTAHGVDYRLRRIETLCEMERWVDAKKETIQLLEETPYFWKAQEMLLRIVERESESLASRVPDRSPSGAGAAAQEKGK